LKLLFNIFFQFTYFAFGPNSKFKSKSINIHINIVFVIYFKQLLPILLVDMDLKFNRLIRCFRFLIKWLVYAEWCRSVNAWINWFHFLILCIIYINRRYICCIWKYFWAIYFLDIRSKRIFWNLSISYLWIKIIVSAIKNFTWLLRKVLFKIVFKNFRYHLLCCFYFFNFIILLILRL
jgi:hypothetical protein